MERWAALRFICLNRLYPFWLLPSTLQDKCQKKIQKNPLLFWLCCALLYPALLFIFDLQLPYTLHSTSTLYIIYIYPARCAVCLIKENSKKQSMSADRSSEDAIKHALLMLQFGFGLSKRLLSLSLCILYVLYIHISHFPPVLVWVTVTDCCEWVWVTEKRLNLNLIAEQNELKNNKTGETKRKWLRNLKLRSIC